MATRTAIISAVSTFLLSAPLFADDLHGTDTLLCSAVEATVCDVDGECVSGPPWDWDVPQFLEIDLKKKLIATTAASGENRNTPIRNQERADGVIVLQGVQQGRAFSFVINVTTGIASVAIATGNLTVSIFAACTPLKSPR